MDVMITKMVYEQNQILLPAVATKYNLPLEEVQQLFLTPTFYKIIMSSYSSHESRETPEVQQRCLHEGEKKQESESGSGSRACSDADGGRRQARS